MRKGFEEAFYFKVIYIFTVNDEVHRGLLKIGDATLHTNTPVDQLSPDSHELNQAALTRIKSYTNTAGLTPVLLHTELATRMKRNDDGSSLLEAFRDYQVQEVLKNSGIKNKEIGDSTGREWYEIDLKTAQKAIDAVKHFYANLSNSDVVKYSPIILRPEQSDCINKVVKHFKKADRFLINAKMRFGKTLVSLEIVKRCGFEKTIILTHRPVVDAGWYEDFGKVFHGKNDIIYGSKATGYTVDQLLKTGKKFIYFASIQDLRGSEEVGGGFDKNDTVFNTVWDCVIVDEAHEGTTTALGEKTVKAVVKEDSGTKFLALSGTPFNIMTEYDSDSIYTWDYIMEQENKSEWDKLHFGDHNPYDELPELRIYTYDLGDILRNSKYITYEDKAFNFREFFRTYTGDFSVDYANMPDRAKVGDFVHEGDVWSFLNLMTKADANSQYPFSNEKYRKLFKHTLWMVPGVREAKALKALMLKHEVFGNGQFNIVNVAGDGDEEEKSEEALTKVRNAIKEAEKDDSYTITLSCGKLTTGVTVREWTAVFMLAGSYSTSAANYLQTIFRVQSPCNVDGKIKENAYVFDFAPDRTLKMVSSAVQISARAGKTSESDKAIMGKFLNYCPVIAVSGSEMKEYNANRLLQQLKRAYADRVVRNGFDDSNLYNDKLLQLDQLDIKKFDELKGLIGTSKAAPKANDITVNDQGLTNEEYEDQEKLSKKKKKDLTPEERERLEEYRKKIKIKNDAISILRGISIRMPLMIYGADIPYDEEITLDRFVDIVDDSSWEEFMPSGVTKEKFKEFQKYYDEEVFVAAGRRVRNIAREADTLEPTERIKKIAGLFSYFKNPDKETVLTPWRVVNMHMSDCLGGWCFYDETFSEDNKLDEPRFVDRGKVTKDIFDNLNVHILEINSKTGLYPLYVTYSVYRRALREHKDENLTIQDMSQAWNVVVKNNVFVICKTPMAKTITKRTLVGYSDTEINAHYFDDLVNIMENKPQQFVEKVRKESYWKKGNGEMQFDAIVGNPPYMLMDNGAQASARPIYQYFVSTGIMVNAEYLSLIIPTRWYTGGKGLDDFRDKMLDDDHIEELYDVLTPEDVFPNTNIRGGVCYFLWDKNYDNRKQLLRVVTMKNHETISDEKRPLKIDGIDVFVRYNEAISIIEKVKNNETVMLDTWVSPRRPFGIDSSFSKSDSFKRNQSKNSNIKCLAKGMVIGYISDEYISNHSEWIDKWKVFMPRANNIGTELNDDNLNVIVGEPNMVCTEAYIAVGIGHLNNREECENLAAYMKTKFARFMHSICKASQDATAKTFAMVPAPDLSAKLSDADLYKLYGLSKKEIDFIESMIKPMD